MTLVIRSRRTSTPTIRLVMIMIMITILAKISDQSVVFVEEIGNDNDYNGDKIVMESFVCWLRILTIRMLNVTFQV